MKKDQIKLKIINKVPQDSETVSSDKSSCSNRPSISRE